MAVLIPTYCKRTLHVSCVLQENEASYRGLLRGKSPTALLELEHVSWPEVVLVFEKCLPVNIPVWKFNGETNKSASKVVNMKCFSEDISQ